MAVGGLTDLLMKIAEGKDAILALPGSENCFDPTAQYGIDGVTEKVGKLTISLSFHCHFHTKKYYHSHPLHYFPTLISIKCILLITFENKTEYAFQSYSARENYQRP